MIIFNLKLDKGKYILIELVKKGDVLIENYVFGVMDIFGVGVDVLMGVNLCFVYVLVIGYGFFGFEWDSFVMDIIV